MRPYSFMSTISLSEYSPCFSLVRKIVCAGLALVFVLSLALRIRASEQHTYIETTGDSTQSFTWNLNVSGDSIEINSYQGEEKFYNLVDRQGLTRKWIYVRGKDRVTVERSGNFLIYSGRKSGEPFKKKVEIDDSPWFQPLSYSLRKFNLTKLPEIEFWLVRQDTLDPVKLTAKKTGSLDNGKCAGSKAFRIEISPVGLFSRLWKASYWFREDDNLFCRYEGRHGILDTSLTVVCLDDTQD